MTTESRVSVEGLNFTVMARGADDASRAARTEALLRRWRDQISQRKVLFSTVSILPLAACGDSKTVRVKDPTDISGRSGLDGYTLNFLNANSTLTLTPAQHNSLPFINTAGTQTLVFSAAGAIATKPGIENYQIIEGSTLSISPNTAGVNVTKLDDGDDTTNATTTVVIGGMSPVGTFSGFGPLDTLELELDANISGMNGGGVLGFGAINFAGANGVSLTMTVAQHNAMTMQGTANFQTIALADGGAIAAKSGIEAYDLSNEGNTITVNGSQSDVNIKGGSGDDIIVVGGFAASGTYSGLTSNDAIRVLDGADLTAVNGGAAFGAGILDVNGAAGTYTMTQAQHEGLETVGNADGEQTIRIVTGGTITGFDGIENYVLSDGGHFFVANSDELGVNITAGGGADTIVVGILAVSGTYAGLSAFDTISVTAGANISGVNGGGSTGAGILDLNGSSGTYTMSTEQHEHFDPIVNKDGLQTFSLTTSGTIHAEAGIEAYELSDVGNTIVVNAAQSSVNIEGGAGADIIVVGGLAVSGTYSGLTSLDTISAAAGADLSGVNGGAATGAGRLDVHNTSGVFAMSQAQHEAFEVVDNLIGIQTFAISTRGNVTARDNVENYLLSGEGNTITVSDTQPDVNIEGGSGDDVIVVGSFAASGTYSGLTSSDAIRVLNGADLTAVNGGAALGAGILDAHDAAGTYTMTQAQHEGLHTAIHSEGDQTIRIVTGGTITALDGIEEYLLSNAGNSLIVNSDEPGVNVTGGAGADTIVVGGLAVSGTYTGLTAADTISVTAGAAISAINNHTATGAGTLDLNNSTGPFILSLAQNEAFDTFANKAGEQTFVLTTSGTVNAEAGIENYHLADAGGSTFMQSASTTSVSVRSGAGDDLIVTQAADALRDAMSIDLSSGGNDTIRILNDTGSLAGNGTVSTGYGGFGATPFGTYAGYNQGSFANTASGWSATKPGSDTFVEVEGFTAFATDSDRDTIQLSGYTGALIESINRTTTDLNGVASGAILEINSADSGFTIAINQAGSLSTVATMLSTLSNVADGEYYAILYDGSDTNANAFLYYARATEGDGFDFADTNGASGGYDTDSLELLAVFHDVGANAFSSLNFEAAAAVGVP